MIKTACSTILSFTGPVKNPHAIKKKASIIDATKSKTKFFLRSSSELISSFTTKVFDRSFILLFVVLLVVLLVLGTVCQGLLLIVQ